MNTSGIALATNDTLDPQSPKYHWNDEGLVLKSTRDDNFNAIDPNIVFDARGPALAKLRQLLGRHQDAPHRSPLQASRRLPIPRFTLWLRARCPNNADPPKPGLPADWQAIEAPFIVRHGDYYYLFVSFDLCCRGTQSTYRTMVGRSPHVTGPYVDADGKPMLKGGGTQLLSPTAAGLALAESRCCSVLKATSSSSTPMTPSPASPHCKSRR